uniref:Uncharacterized protein n=1 Tax=Catagonus wagneri TaxID=51154 RepID=A0A8C3YQV6_9CETA
DFPFFFLYFFFLPSFTSSLNSSLPSSLPIILMLDSLILKWWAVEAEDLNLWYISSNSTFSCSVMTFFCFLGALPASLEHFLWVLQCYTVHL